MNAKVDSARDAELGEGFGKDGCRLCGDGLFPPAFHGEKITEAAEREEKTSDQPEARKDPGVRGRC